MKLLFLEARAAATDAAENSTRFIEQTRGRMPVEEGDRKWKTELAHAGREGMR
jgi:hypothetical protein